MRTLGFRSGLTPRFLSPPPGPPEVDDVITEEAGVRAPLGEPPRVVVIAEAGAMVAQGAPVARLRDAPEVCFVAPMPSRVARVGLLQGHRLSEITLFHEAGGDVLGHDTSASETKEGLRRLMQNSGIWTWLRRRPFGGFPGADEEPAAIFVMAADTTPLSPDPRQALAGRHEAFGRGLHALARLTAGPVFLCQRPGPALVDDPGAYRQLRVVEIGPRHPQGLAGFCVHARFPASIDAPVWDIHAEDVAALGSLLETGRLPMTRLVSIGGPALRAARLVRTQAGADLRGLTQRIVKPGSHVLLSGGPLDGHQAHWLAPRDRQITVQSAQSAAGPSHWLVAALTRSATAPPVIPSGALDQSFGGALPAAAFVRALGAGDDETAMRMGLLSLLEEDVALADYVLGGTGHLAELLRGMLDRIQTELAP